MYLGVDVGGTKTLVALFDKRGQLKASEKFPTPAKYDEFLQQLAETVAKMSTGPFDAACIALPGRLDHASGVGIRFGNLPWREVPVVADCKRLFRCPVAFDNDAKLAGLSEAKLIIKDFKKALYITISTGIGFSIINDGVIDHNIGDGGGRSMLIDHGGKMIPWEDFASGSAIVRRYGKRASEINDPKIWNTISRDFAVGMIDLIAVLAPEVIIIGGGVGAHFKKFEKPLKAVLKSYETPMMPIPPIRQAKRPEEAVIYGCYDLLKALYGTRSKKS